MSGFSEGQHLEGTVISFDEHAGLGEVETQNGVIPFHCTNIADGTRAIDVDAHVNFVAHWHPRGRFEAIDIVKSE